MNVRGSQLGQGPWIMNSEIPDKGQWVPMLLSAVGKQNKYIIRQSWKNIVFVAIEGVKWKTKYI